MTKNYFIQLCNQQLKLVRAECSFTQEKMALVLGISKKTLVEIEKGRSSLGWGGSVVLCTIFAGSKIIIDTFGGAPTDVILSLAFEGSEPEYAKVLNKGIFWQTIRENDGYKIQQNIISQHYRLLSGDGKRIASSFVLEDLLALTDEKQRAESTYGYL